MDWKLLGQWVGIIGVGIGLYISQDRRITTLEASWVQERSGYAIAITTVNARLDRIEAKLDRVIERTR